MGYKRAEEVLPAELLEQIQEYVSGESIYIPRRKDSRRHWGEQSGTRKELVKRKILSPTGKEKWCKRTIDVMLSNEKYTGDVRLLKSGKSEVHYLASGNNPAIISKEIFEAVDRKSVV